MIPSWHYAICKASAILLVAFECYVDGEERWTSPCIRTESTFSQAADIGIPLSLLQVQFGEVKVPMEGSPRLDSSYPIYLNRRISCPLTRTYHLTFQGVYKQQHSAPKILCNALLLQLG